jgi:hypothetical protein
LFQRRLGFFLLMSRVHDQSSSLDFSSLQVLTPVVGLRIASLWISSSLFLPLQVFCFSSPVSPLLACRAHPAHHGQIGPQSCLPVVVPLGLTSVFVFLHRTLPFVSMFWIPLVPARSPRPSFVSLLVSLHLCFSIEVLATASFCLGIVVLKRIDFPVWSGLL